MSKEYQEEYININGANHYLLHYKINPDAPVMLYIHGGPGQSEAMFAYVIEDFAKRNYNVVYYDQRGAGKTYLKNKKLKANMKLLNEDLIKIVLHLKKEYGKDKIGILGHSFGSILGSVFAIEHPEHVLYLVGCGQLINVKENEGFGYKKVKELIDKSGDANDKKYLDAIGDYPGDGGFNKAFMGKMKRLRKLQAKYNLVSGPDKEFMRMIKESPIVGVKDYFTLMLGAMHNKEVVSEMFSFDLRNYGMEYKVPVYYIIGENDNQTPVEISTNYFQNIMAPEKKFYLIKNAGHTPMLENKADYQKAICEIAGKY